MGGIRAFKKELALSLGIAILVFLPWCVRNYRVFETWIPIKSNLFYELDQALSQTTDGIIDTDTFKSHPFVAEGPQREEYRTLGEVGFVRKSHEHWLEEAKKTPAKVAKHIANRLAAATVYYLPMNPRDRQDTVRWAVHAIWYAIPMLWLVLVAIRVVKTTPSQRLAIILFVAFLLPYVLVSYYHRYSLPVLPFRMFFVLWFMREMFLGKNHLRANAAAC